MGDPKKLKKKYQTPAHPWVKTEIEEGKKLRQEYGLKTRKDVLVASSFLKKYKNIAKRLIADTSKQGEKEKEQMILKLQKVGLLSAAARLDDVLSLTVKDILERRIQTLVFRKGLARTANQARQFITHRHILVGNKEITSPSKILTQEEESQLSFKQNSALSSEMHPERANIAKEVAEEKAKVEGTPEEKMEKKEEKKAQMSPVEKVESKGKEETKTEVKK